MENASKAVLIAGAILIALAVTSIGMWVYFQVQAAVKNISIDMSAITAHNARYTQYIGEVSGSEVKSCISIALSNNTNEKVANDFKINVSVGSNDYVKWTNDNKSGRLSICDNMSANIKVNQRYDGQVVYNEKGIISKIVFTLK